jgi:hypothetical protein
VCSREGQQQQHTVRGLEQRIAVPHVITVAAASLSLKSRGVLCALAAATGVLHVDRVLCAAAGKLPAWHLLLWPRHTRTLPLRPWASTQPFFSIWGEMPFRLFLTTPSGMLLRPTLVMSVLPPPEATGLTTLLRDGRNALRVNRQPAHPKPVATRSGAPHAITAAPGCANTPSLAPRLRSASISGPPGPCARAGVQLPTLPLPVGGGARMDP